MNKKALIAMSGGVDSSVAAYLMTRQGYECMGVTMKLFDNEDVGIGSEKTCCSLKDMQDASSVAYSLDMIYHVLNFSLDFKKEVIQRFVEAYQVGATPNPCIDCNRYIKFHKLLQRALMLEMDYLVTGHYARIEYEEVTGRYLLKKAIDTTKDQTYFLYSMTQEQLAHTLFPLGNLHKTEIREIASKQGFVNAKKHDSQDICFVKNGEYAQFIEQYTDTSYEVGNFIDRHGNVLGCHKGIIRYTVGQRRGLGLSFPHPMYVRSINVSDNTVTLCEEEWLYSKSLTTSDFNWIAFEYPSSPLKVKAKIRYKQSEQSATVKQISPEIVHVEFDEPQRAITKGQAVVLYDGDVVLGGGTISDVLDYIPSQKE